MEMPSKSNVHFNLEHKIVSEGAAATSVMVVKEKLTSQLPEECKG